MFGDGHEYDWALNEEEETGLEDELPKLEMKYQDVRNFKFSIAKIVKRYHRYLNPPRFVRVC